MVKLFVGNLAEGVDSHRLRNLFLQYVQVEECDVLKNFAFVHVITDEDAQLVIDKLEKYNLEGREIHIERSTSRLRKEPGMSDKCFTCGATDHKTPNCPQEMQRRKKRGIEDEIGPDGKRPAMLPTINLASAPSNSPMPTVGSTSVTMAAQPAPWGCKIGGGSDVDPELPCPTNPELRTLYDQYLDSRTRYFFFRERLSKELSLQPQQQAQLAHMGRIDLTRQQSILATPPHAQPKPMAVLSQQMPTQVQYAASPYSTQPQQPPAAVYASAPQIVAASAPPYATAVAAPSPYGAVVTSMPQQAVPVSAQPTQIVQHLMTSMSQPHPPPQQQPPPQQMANIAPAAPYNTMAAARQPPIVSYSIEQNYRAAPSAPPMYTTVHYSTIPR